MKKIQLLIATLFFAANVHAQKSFQQKTPANVMQAHQVIKKINLESQNTPGSTPVEYTPKATEYKLFSNGVSEEVIGETYYDLQTNSAIQNRLFVHEDGTISATWTMSPDKLSYFPNRGTGYNYFDGESWMDMPTSRVEESRIGWPSVAGLNGGEIITSHAAIDGLSTNIATRTEKGNGDWLEDLLQNSDDGVAYGNGWPRMKVGGADGQSIHIISHTYSAPENSYITYSRSQNAGESFDIIDYLIPEIGPEFYNGFGGDCYSLDVQGETIAIVIGDAWTDVVLVKSIDNGSTWTKTIVKEHPIPMWNDSIIVDSLNYPEFEGIIESSDQSFSISLDENGNAHIFYGLMSYSNSAANDDSWSNYPSSDGLVYWNEVTQTEEVIAYVADANGNDTLDLELASDGSSVAIAYYGRSLTSYPSSAIADNGDIYLIYSSIIEYFSQDQLELGDFGDEIFLEHYRHQYIMRSQDGGVTWSTPYDLMTETTDPLTGNTLQEGVFGCISNIVNDNVYLTYQRDLYPGLNLLGDEDPITKNSIVFMTVPIESFENDNFTVTGCTDILACNYELDEPCVYPGENEFNNYIENYFDVNQIDVLGASGFVQGSDVFSQGTSVYLQGSNIFTQGTSLLFYGVSAFLEMIVDEIYSVFEDYESETVFDCEGCINDIDANNICDEFQVGCPFPEFLEYNPIALTFDFELCQTYIVYGCIDVWALNFNANANVDDGTCEYINCDIASQWEVTNTGSNMTLMIPSDVDVTINGQDASYGSALGVFYEDSYGDLQCAGYTLLTGVTSHISAMADDETTEEIDGLIGGEQMIWQIFDETTCLVYSGSVLYSMGSNIFTPNDLAFVESVTYSCQLIEFPAGWFMFSSYIESGNIDLVYVLEDLGDKVIIVKDNYGDAYLPEWSYNGIGDMINGQGYNIKLSEIGLVEICGTYLLPEINPIELTPGWNTIAYLRLEPANVEMVFESVVTTGNLVMVKDYNGNPYLPEWNYNGIGDLYPGQGYQLKVIEPDVIQYLSNSLEYRPFTIEVVENNLKHFKRLEPTGNNMHIVFPTTAWTKHAYSVVEIAAYNLHGRLIGSTVCSSENTVLTLWGNDETTNSIDGLLGDESITFKLWNGTERLDFEVENWNEGSNRYSVNAINIVGTVKIGEEGNQLFESQPNPSNTVTTISFFIAEKGNVKISVYNVLGELVKGVVNSENIKGYHAININVSSLKPGSYYYTMETNNFKKSKQLVIIK